MTTLFSNSLLSEYTISDRSAHLHFFRDVQQQVSFHLQEQAEYVCAVFLDAAEIDLHFFAHTEGVKARVFAFLPALGASRSVLKVHMNLLASHSEVYVHLIAIQDEGASASLQGTIEIAEQVEKVSGHLLEEVILLGKSSYTALQPILTVASPDVQASHGAKIHRIAQDTLFYMQSRGLNMGSALSMIIDSYLQQILGYFALSEDEKIQVKNFVR